MRSFSESEMLSVAIYHLHVLFVRKCFALENLRFHRSNHDSFQINCSLISSTRCFRGFEVRHGISRKHASIACRQFLKKLWTFLEKLQFSLSFYPPMPTSLHYYPQLIHFCLKISDIMEKSAVLGTLICLGTIWIRRHFLTKMD